MALLAPTGGTVSVPELLFILAAVLVSAKLLGELVERFGQPAVLGELAAGVVVGVSGFGIVDPTLPVLELLAEIGVILLLFEIGLETDLGRLLRVGAESTVVAAAGVALPFALGYAASRALGLPALPALVAGAALTATSVGITARVLSDLRRLQDPEGQVILGAAVIDDVIGLVILATVAELVGGTRVTAIGVARIAAAAFGFLALAVLVGRLAVPPLFARLARLGRPETLAAMALAFAFLLASLAHRAGSAAIIGAFAAGLVLAPTPQARTIGRGVAHLGHFFVPIFFVAVGAAVDLRALLRPQVAGLAAVLLAVAIVGKVAAGYVPVWFRGRKAVVGVGMVPRGEVGLIFAQMGLVAGVLESGVFSALAAMVFFTTLLAPPLLRALYPPRPGVGVAEAGGVAEMTTEA